MRHDRIIAQDGVAGLPQIIDAQSHQPQHCHGQQFQHIGIGQPALAEPGKDHGEHDTQSHYRIARLERIAQKVHHDPLGSLLTAI